MCYSSEATKERRLGGLCAISGPGARACVHQCPPRTWQMARMGDPEQVISSGAPLSRRGVKGMNAKDTKACVCMCKDELAVTIDEIWFKQW